MPAKALPYDSTSEPLTCSKCGRVVKNKSGLGNHQNWCSSRPVAPPAIKPLAITVTRLSANDPAIDERIAEIAARETTRFRPLPSAHTVLAADLTPHERAVRQHGGAPKVGR